MGRNAKHEDDTSESEGRLLALYCCQNPSSQVQASTMEIFLRAKKKVINCADWCDENGDLGETEHCVFLDL